MLFALLLASAVAAAPAAPVGRPWLDARAPIARRVQLLLSATIEEKVNQTLDDFCTPGRKIARPADPSGTAVAVAFSPPRVAQPPSPAATSTLSMRNCERIAISGKITASPKLSARKLNSAGDTIFSSARTEEDGSVAILRRHTRNECATRTSGRAATSG